MSSLTVQNALQKADLKVKAFAEFKKKKEGGKDALKKEQDGLVKDLKDLIKEMKKESHGPNSFKEGVLKMEGLKGAGGSLGKLLKEWKEDIAGGKSGKKQKKPEEAKSASKDKSSNDAVEILEYFKTKDPLDQIIKLFVNMERRKNSKQNAAQNAEKKDWIYDFTDEDFGGMRRLFPHGRVQNVAEAHEALSKMKVFSKKEVTISTIQDQYKKIFGMKSPNKLVKGPTKGDIVTDIEIFEENVWKLISNISELVIYPGLTNLLVKKCFKANKKIETLLKKNKLILCFVLRNLLACFSFETVLSRAAYDCLRKEVKAEDGFQWATNTDWRNAIAFVGFNRLMSPNNKAGVSISSDIDFKLVFDPSIIKFAKKKKEEVKALEKDQIKTFSKALNDSLGAWTDRFDRARLTLEVEKFTTKATTEVKEALTFEAEKNFYASMIGNHVCVTGDKDVYDKFITIIKECIAAAPASFIAQRTFDQYLGVTDKGSIAVIEKFSKFREVVDACTESDTMIKYKLPQKKTPHFYAVLHMKKTQFEEQLGIGKAFTKLENSMGELQKREWLAIPKVFYKMIDSKGKNDKHELLELLLKEKAVEEKLSEIAKLPLFKNTKDKQGKADLAKVLQLVAKLIKGVSAGSPDFHRPRLSDYVVVGTNRAIAGRDWSYNIKYCGCRLSDFYDAVTLKEYQKWNKSKDAKATYDEGRKIAVAINKFALEMQSAIYMNAVTQLLPPTHADIDNLYARMTRDEFEDIMEKSRMKHEEEQDVGMDILPALKALGKATTGEVSKLAKKLELHIEDGLMQALPEEIHLSKDRRMPFIQPWSSGTVISEREKDSLKFFQALFKLAADTAKKLKPPKKN